MHVIADVKCKCTSIRYYTVRKNCSYNDFDEVKQSKAKQSKSKQSKANQSKAKQIKANQSKSKQIKANQSKSKQIKAKQSKANQSITSPS